ncbi:hypothetical protein [Endozoicomonas arenosclerae]|uniref:hypothetical protein n=1 Tax=Endozoicomonas arenosclerae TaxID=1633495 RepID=UPI000780683C|nr:hypothetical protein [Endozoicomonas arenosclerae]
MADGKSKESNFLKYLPLLPLIIAYLYLIGYYYQLGYLSEYGLSNSFFPQTVQDYLLGSFVAITAFIMHVFETVNEKKYLMAIPAAIVFVVTLGLVAFVKFEKEVKNTVSKVKEKKTIQYLISVFQWVAFPSIAAALTASIYYIGLVVLLFIVFIPYSAMLYGNKVATDEKSGFLHCKLKELPEDKGCTFLIDEKGNTLFGGLVVAQSTTHIAMWNKEGSEVFPKGKSKIKVRGGKLPVEKPEEQAEKKADDNKEEAG